MRSSPLQGPPLVHGLKWERLLFFLGFYATCKRQWGGKRSVMAITSTKFYTQNSQFWPRTAEKTCTLPHYKMKYGLLLFLMNQSYRGSDTAQPPWYGHHKSNPEGSSRMVNIFTYAKFSGWLTFLRSHKKSKSTRRILEPLTMYRKSQEFEKHFLHIYCLLQEICQNFTSQNLYSTIRWVATSKKGHYQGTYSEGCGAH